MMLGLDFTVILKKALCMFIWTILKFHAKSSPPIWRPEGVWRHVKTIYFTTKYIQFILRFHSVNTYAVI